MARPRYDIPKELMEKARQRVREGKSIGDVVEEEIGNQYTGLAKDMIRSIRMQMKEEDEAEEKAAEERRMNTFLEF